MNKSSKVNAKEFWEERYLNKTMPWDIGEAAPAFVKYFKKVEGKWKTEEGFRKSLPSTFYRLPSTLLKVSVLGCGLGHDAFYIANLKDYNLQVYGFDFSENAINHCNEIREKENIKNVQFIRADFFELTKDKRWKNFFDVVIEHTSLAAIDPKRRIEYINLIKYLLKPGGKLVGLFFIRPKELKGPPFGIEVEEVRELFKQDFREIEKLYYEKCLHSGKLEGDEYFGVFEKTG